MHRLGETYRWVARLRPAAAIFTISTLLLGCRTRETVPAGKPEDPGKVGTERGYFLQDTFSLPAGPNQYYATKLYKGRDLVDTISVGLGWNRIDSERIVYERIRTSIDSIWNETKDTLLDTYSEARKEGITVFDGMDRRTISDRMVHYDAFSSPLLMDGCIYYWGIPKGLNASYRVHAMKFDMLAERTDSLFLFEAELATDDEGYFNRPYLEDSGLIYEAEEEMQKWKIDLLFRNAEKMAAPGSQRFEKFLRRFFTDEGFQADRIDFPIQGHYTYLCDNPGDDVCKKDTVFALDKAGWQYHEYGYGTHPSVKYRVKNECPKAKEAPGLNCLLAELDQAETDFNLNLYFAPKDNSWRLVYLDYFEP